jgi:hypothetical protein
MREGMAKCFLLELVSQAHSLVRFTRSLICCACAISSKHFSAPPTGKSHEVLFLAAFREPAVGERVSEHMWMQVFKTTLLRPSPEHLADAVVSHDTASTQPECRIPGKAMLASFSEIALKCLPSLISKGTGAGSATFPEYNRNVLIKINLRYRETR